MYGIESLKNALGSNDRASQEVAVSSIGHRAVPRVVLWIGMTSLLTDLATEMVGSVLPAFLFSVLLLPPLMVGFMDGLYQGAAAILRLPTGMWADKYQHHKQVAALGYGMSVIAKIGLLFSMQWGLLFALMGLGLDRVGKAVRPAPRDVLIAAHAQEGQQGAAFGLHRAMDAVGALTGPLLAFLILAASPENYELLLAISLVFAALGLIALLVKVPSLKDRSRETAAEVSVQKEGNSARKTLFGNLRAQRAYWFLLGCATALSLGLVSDGMLYLYLQQNAGVPSSWLPLFYSGTALIFVLSAYPIGKLADKVGAKWIVVGGHALLMLWYLVMLHVPKMVGVGGTLVVMGFFYAATDGVLMAQAALLLPESVRTSGLALLGALMGLGRMASSTLFGALWQWQGQSTAFWVFSAALALAVLLAAWLWPNTEVA